MKLHYVYYAIQKDGTPKYGVTTNPSNRCKYYLQWNLVSAYTCPQKAGDKEIELQQKQFGKRDNSKHYAHWLKIRYSKKGIEGCREGGRTAVKLIQAQGKHIHRGEKAGNSKLTDKQVRFIKNNYGRANTKGIAPKGKISGVDLAKKFNTSKYNISNIVRNITWKHIKP